MTLWWLPLVNVKGWLTHGGYLALGALVLAGSVGLPFGVFFLANAAGAFCDVPLEVGIGYAVAYGVGHLSARHAQQVHLALCIALFVAITAFATGYLGRHCSRKPTAG